MGPLPDGSHGLTAYTELLLFGIAVAIGFAVWLFRKGCEHARGIRPISQATPAVEVEQEPLGEDSVVVPPRSILDRAVCVSCGAKLSRTRDGNDVEPPWWMRRFRVEHQGHDVLMEIDCLPSAESTLRTPHSAG
jgi:hypothetical protein